MTQIIKSNNGGGGGGTGGEAKRGEISGNILTQTDLVEELDKRVEASELSTVAFSGEFGDLKNIPDETDPVFMASAASNIDASDITNWNGKYTKPTTGIPKTDLSTDVKTSLGKADTAVQPNVLNSFATLVDLANGLRDKQDKALVTTLDNADDEHYPSAKAVADAMSGAGLGDMMKAVYDPTNKNADAFDAQNQYNLDTELSNTSEKAVQNKVITAKINDIELSKAPNVSIVGEPTITQGNISGFSISNYLIAPFLSSFAGYPFTFHMDITTGSNVTTQQNILDSSYGLAFAISGGKFVIALSTNGTSWDLGSHTGTYAVKANTSYCIEIEWTGSNYILRVSTDRVNFTTDITVAGASALSGSTLYIGGHGEVDHPFGGTINLNEWQFLSGTIVVWKGMDDAGLATRANLSLSNLNVQGEERLNNLVDSYFLKEDVDYTVSFNATKGVAPYSTSYGYTEITITNPLIKEKLGATYQFSINTKPATSTYRNVRVRFGESGEWYGLGANNSVSAQYTRFTKTYPCIFVFKEQSSSSTTAKYFSEVYVNTTYSAMTAAEAQTGTATSGRTMTAKVLADEITRREGLYHDSTKQDVISDIDDIRTNASNGAAAKTTVDTHVANGTIHVTASDKVAWSNKYAKPDGGIPKSDLSSSVQTSLGKADTALQGFTESDPTVPSHVKSITQTNITNWNGKLDNPRGGTTGQVLTKTATGTEWKDSEGGLPELGENGQVLTVTGGERDTQGPSPDGYHVPTKDEWKTVYDAGVALGQWSSIDGDSLRIKLKLPFAGYRNYNNATTANQGFVGGYWSSSPYSSSDGAYILNFSSNIDTQNNSGRAMGRPVRCFRNFPLIPSASWTTIYAGSNGSGIYHNPTEGVISISSDGQTWITIADKNLGATQVYNNGDELSEANCGKYYQWGNNYGFPFTGTVTTSSTKVNASSYGPGNYYSSDTWIAARPWDSSDNRNLRGGVTDLRPENKAEWKDNLYPEVVDAVPATYTEGKIYFIKKQ